MRLTDTGKSGAKFSLSHRHSTSGLRAFQDRVTASQASLQVARRTGEPVVEILPVEDSAKQKWSHSLGVSRSS
jgi:hypothetical protein